MIPLTSRDLSFKLECSFTGNHINTGLDDSWNAMNFILPYYLYLEKRLKYKDALVAASALEGSMKDENSITFR